MTVRLKSEYPDICLGLLMCATLAPWEAKADWLSLTGAETAPNIAEIYGQDDRARLVLETYVGVIITYLTDGVTGEVAVNWELFTDPIQQVPATLTDPAGPLPTFLTPDDNVHTWTNYLINYRPPTVQAVAIAGSLGVLQVPVVGLYDAIVTIEAVVGTRKITEEEVIEENRIDPTGSAVLRRQ